MRRPLSYCLFLLPVMMTACADHAAGGAEIGQGLSVVAFDSRTEIPTGVSRTAAAIAFDADGDGLVDLAAVDAGGALALRIAQGGGAFATAQNVAVTPGAFRVLAGDVDNDGDADLVSAATSGTADVLLNDGSGGFAADSTVAIGPNAVEAALHDLDGDGALDLVVIHVGTRQVSQFFGVGDGSFRSPVARTFDRGAEVVGMSVGDVDGDGRAEIACCDLLRDNLIVLPGDGSPAVIVPVGPQPVATAIGDVTADGQPEIVVSVLGESRVKVFARSGASWNEIGALDPGGQPFDLLIADIDADGASDLCYTLLDRRAIAVHLVSGQALSQAATISPATGSPFDPQLADLNGDGRGDLFVPAFGSGLANVYFGRSGGVRGGRLHAMDGVASPDVVHAADFLGDGTADVIAASFSSRFVSIAEARFDTDGESRMVPLTRIDMGRNVQNVIPADLDADGRVDFVVPIVGGVKLIRNLGPVANFRFMLDVLPGGNDVLAAGSGPFEVVVEDVDADGRVDLVIAYHEANKVALLRGTPTPFEFAAPQETAIAGRPLGIATGDFDGDGVREVAIGRLDLATISVLSVEATGLSITSDTPVGAGPFALRSADFDADGRTDLVVSELGTSRVRMLISLPGGGFRSVDIEAGTSPTALLTRDLNRDGRPDILVASLVGADFRILLGDGSGGVSQSLVFPGVNMALSAAVADVDGDGLEDLLIGSLTSQGVALFRNVSRPE